MNRKNAGYIRKATHIPHALNLLDRDVTYSSLGSGAFDPLLIPSSPRLPNMGSGSILGKDVWV
jgi:hypothetical protein